MIDKVTTATEPTIPLGHGATAHRHAIVIMETNKKILAIGVDMLLIKIRAQREGKPATLAEKLVILLMFVDQNLEP